MLVNISFLSADHYRPWSSFHAEAAAIAGILFGAIVLTVRREGFSTPLFWFFWSGCVTAASLLQWWLLPDIFAGDLVIAGIFMSSLVCAVALGHYVGQNRGELLVAALGTLAGVSTLSAFIGILQWLSLGDILGVFGVPTAVGERAMGNVAQPNQLGTLILMGLCAYAYLFDRRYINNVTIILLAAVSTFAIALTQSRTALLSATALTAFLCISSRAKLRTRRGWISFWLAALWFIFFLTPTVNDWLLIAPMRDVPLMSSSGRDSLWKQVGYAILQHPWRGYGWNRTATAQMAAVSALPGEFTITYAHNVVLDFMAWFGVPVALGLVGALVYWFWSRWRQLDSPLGFCSFAALIPFGVHSMLEYPFAYGYFLMTAGLLAGIVEASVGASCQQVSRRVATPLLAMIVVLGLVTVYEYIEVEEDFRATRFANLHIGPVPESFEYSSFHVLTQMRMMLRATRIRPHTGMTSSDIALLRRAANRFPYGALTYRYVEALALNEQIDAAKKELLILRGLYGRIYYQSIQLEIAERGRSHPALLKLLED